MHAVLDLLPSSRIIVVDDGSPDGTGDLAEELALLQAQEENRQLKAQNAACQYQVNSQQPSGADSLQSVAQRIVEEAAKRQGIDPAKYRYDFGSGTFKEIPAAPAPPPAAAKK